MKKFDIEVVVGLFVCIGLLCMAYISIHLGKVDIFNNNFYSVKASFTSASGLKADSNVEISGVPVGKVEGIELKDYQAIVTMQIKGGIAIQEDAIASVKTNGILGEKYIDISPGSSDVLLGPGDVIFDTEPPFDLLYVLKNFVVDE